MKVIYKQFVVQLKREVIYKSNIFRVLFFISVFE